MGPLDRSVFWRRSVRSGHVVGLRLRQLVHRRLVHRVRCQRNVSQDAIAKPCRGQCAALGDPDVREYHIQLSSTADDSYFLRFSLSLPAQHGLPIRWSAPRADCLRHRSHPFPILLQGRGSPHAIHPGYQIRRVRLFRPLPLATIDA